jgi:hypothetical protein
MTCTYRFKGTNGKQVVIKGQAAFKAFLADGGLEQLRGEAAPKFSGRQANVLDRIPALETAAQGIKEGTVTREQYSKLVNKLKPVTPYAEVPAPATVADMQRGLTSDKVERIGVPSETLKAGDPVGLRLDIPAYSNNGVWVVSVHEQGAGYSAGKSIGYESVAAVTNPTFGVVEKAALAIAGGKPKATIAVMKGDWKPVTPKQASTSAKAALKSDKWVQVGMDPTRHAYFYDRASMEPVVSADEAIQIGPLVLAKNPVYGKKSDFAFSKRQELRDAADAIAKMDPEVRDDTMIGDFPGAADGYMLYEARVLVKKPTEKLKRVNENNSFELWNRYDFVANVDGEHFGVTKQEDPDEPDDETKFVYSFAPLDDPFKDVTTVTDQTDELFKEMRASLGGAPALSRRQTTTPEFKRWFGDSKVVNADGTPKLMYHGTAYDISAFKPYTSAAIFFTDNPDFAGVFANTSAAEMLADINYRPLTKEQSEQIKVEAIKKARKEIKDKEQLETVIANIEDDRKIGPAYIFIKEAGRELMPSGPNILPVYVKAENPFDYENAKQRKAVVDKTLELYGKKQKDGNTVLEIDTTARAYNAKELDTGLSAKIDMMYAAEAMGNWQLMESPEIQAAIKALGFDSFYVKEENRKNIAVYKPEQVKSATGNVGTFDVTNPDIRFQRRQDIGAKLQDRVDNDFDALVKEYNRLDGTDGGKVLDTDIARELSPEYRADRSRAGEVHEAVSGFIDKLYQERIENTSPDGVVVFMAGGGGAGKSSAGELISEVFESADIVYDGTLSTYSKAERRIQTALDAGQDVYISYIYREPIDALRNGVLSRAMTTGRTVPLDGLVKGHAGSSETVNRLQETFGDNPAFKIYAIDNSKGWGNATLTSLENIPRVKMEGLKEEFENATYEEYEAGRISEAVYRATVGESVAAAQADRKQDEESVRQGRESGRERNAVSFSQRNIFGQPAPLANWTAPLETKADNVVYALQNKQIDTKRVIEAITQAGTQITNDWNVYLQEELFHGRTSKQTTDFLQTELRPLIEDMQKRKVTLAQFEEYLHNRHAEERNKKIAKVNPKMPDGGSGIDTADAKAYLAGLTPDQKRDFTALAARIDAINQTTRDLLVNSGLESQETIDAWDKAYSNYVPLYRDDIDFSTQGAGGMGTGQGYSVKGAASRRAMGSKKAVIDILANIAMQRERTIVRAEKNRVAMSLYGLAVQNPNTDFWLAIDPAGQKDPNRAMADLMTIGISPLDAKSIIEEPKQRYVDPNTGLVAERINPAIRSNPMVVSTRIDGVEKYVFFNANDERSQRMASALKNLDADQLGYITANIIAPVTRWFAQVNTQFNPIFGAINFIRDSKGAMFNLSTTAIAGQQKAVAGGVFPAMKGIYQATRAERKGRPAPAGSYAQLWDEFQDVGGQTGYRDQFVNSEDRAKALQRMLDPASWATSPLGKVFTAGGTLKVPMEVARKTAAPLFDWLSDYNQTMENAVRLSAYKVALDKGLSKEEAASIAKNLTVNFNRKGQMATQAGAWYAFFNAAIQGSARLIETLRGPAGKKIIAGGLMIGTAQAFLLAAAGFDEDEPPDFIKERNLIIPLGTGGKYLTLPMPLGFNVIPNTSRVMTEWALSGFKNTPKRIGQITGALLETFNPIGNSGWSVQTLAPTIVDPLVALAENRDFTGKPIAKKDRSDLSPTPGYTRTKDTASFFSKQFSYYLNLATGGTDYKPGLFSPTPDQIDYLIGQVTGGVGREAMKIEQSITGAIKGEEVAPYKMPIVGRFYGDTEATANISGKFYENLTMLNKHEAEIKGRKKDRESLADYYEEYPEARLFEKANSIESDIKSLNKRLKELKEKKASDESMKIVKTQITAKMKRLNDMVKDVEK